MPAPTVTFPVQGSNPAVAAKEGAEDSINSALKQNWDEIQLRALVTDLESLAPVADLLVVEDDVARAQSRTGKLAVLPAIDIGARQVEPETVSHDLRLMTGRWADTGLPWDAKGTYAGQALLPETITVDGREVIVLFWSFDLRPMAGLYKDTGRPWPDATGATNYPEMVVKTTATSVNIYRKAGSDKLPTYIQWQVKLYNDAARNSHVWRIDRVFEATRTGTGAFTTGRKILQASEVETAVKIAGRFDFAGGYMHGNEELIGSAKWLVDGVAIDPSVAQTIYADKVELLQSTNLLLPGVDAASQFSPRGPIFMRTDKSATWDADGYRLRTQATEQRAGDSIQYAFFGMLPIQRIDDGDGVTQITHTATRSPDWPTENVAAEGFGMVETKANRVKIWGDRYSGAVEVTRGWEDPTRVVYVDNRAQYNKIYPLFLKDRPEVTAIGTTYEAEVLMQISIKEAL